MTKTIDAKVAINNLPDKPLKTGYMVVRYVDLLLWYYGIYDSYARALSVATELGNGFVIGIENKGNKQ